MSNAFGPAAVAGGRVVQARFPETYPRRVLVCMAGLSPGTITETLFGLVVATPPVAASASRMPQGLEIEIARQSSAAALLGPLSAFNPAQLPGGGSPTRARRAPRPFAPFVPTELHLITTADGEQAMLKGLLAPPKGAEARYPRGVLAQLQADYAAHFGSTPIAFGPEHVHVIRGADGAPVHDFATMEDSEATGNAILNVLRELVKDEDCAIHASIAGGRKSMGVMLALTMSLLGRQQDRLSQVLIPRVFEVPHFYYPPPQPETMEGYGRQVVSTADARITLAMLPLLRVFDGLDLKLRDPGMSFESVIELGEMALEKQMIVIKPAQQRVQIGHLVCKLTAAETGFYTLLAERRLGGAVVPDDTRERAGGVRWRLRWKTDKTVGFFVDDEHFRRARNWCRKTELPDGTVDLRPRTSTINSKLVKAFGPDLAAQALIVGPQKTKGDGIYGLFNADGIYISA